MLARWRAYQALGKRIWIYRRTLHSRFVFYLVSLFGVLTSAVLVLLLLSGFLNPLDHELEKFMDYELQNRRQSLERQMDTLAAHGVNFSKQLSETILWTLQQQGTTLEQLNGHPKLLQNIQHNAYHVVYDTMEKASCSGAFYLLNASVDPKEKTAAHHNTYNLSLIHI